MNKVKDTYSHFNEVQKRYRESHDDKTLWDLFPELVAMSESVLKKNIKYTDCDAYKDFGFVAEEIALEVLNKMKEKYITYPGALANCYAQRYTHKYTYNTYELVYNTAYKTDNDEAYTEMVNGKHTLQEFNQYHLATPLGQLYALQTLVQEQRGDTHTVPPEVINRYLSRKIRIKHKEPVCEEGDYTILFNWDSSGHSNQGWSFWIERRLEQLGTFVDKVSKLPMNVTPFRYEIWAYTYLAEIGIVVDGKPPIYVRERPSFVRRHGNLIETVDLRK
ncbi:hypothetical protein FACS1894172_09280 [Spirochaetia bacterium]|nr:hypothetical protein FACS1894164_11640 [Spirochaetia bacterium]GHU32519.1 hypothetical protein FACS1894172_09280 [Spirochaetia bacterium]